VLLRHSIGVADMSKRYHYSYVLNRVMRYQQHNGCDVKCDGPGCDNMAHGETEQYVPKFWYSMTLDIKLSDASIGSSVLHFCSCCCVHDYIDKRLQQLVEYSINAEVAKLNG